jgi:phage protein D
LLPNDALIPWRSPRLRLIANGATLPGIISAEVFSNNHNAADRFSAVVSIGGISLSSAASWAAETDIMLDVQFSLDGGATFKSLIIGTVDSIAIDPAAGIVRLDGRDLTGSLIETRTQETFTNRTSSEVAVLLASRHNLNPVVTATTSPVGRYYQNEHDRITLALFSRATTEWDLLVFLAQQEGFDVFVTGTELHFQPPSQTPDLIQPVHVNDLIDLQLERSLTLARDIEVVVKSWNSRDQSAFSQTARAARPTGGSSLIGASRSGPPQRYVYVRPNLTQDEALKLAQQKLSELTRHERILRAAMPGELTLTPRSLLTLNGTGTAFDQTYFIDTIDRLLNFDTGFTQHIRAKNSSPRTQSTTPADVVLAVTG